MTDDEFWALLEMKRRRFPKGREALYYGVRPTERLYPRAVRLYVIEREARRLRDDLPVWLKNELKYLDVDLNLHREVGTRIQWFRIAEEEYNGVDEDELWWRSGRDNETRLPSERLGEGISGHDRESRR